MNVDVNVEKVLALRAEFNDAAKGKYKLSLNDFVIKVLFFLSLS